VDGQLTKEFTSTAADRSWLSRTHQGYAVDLEVYGVRMRGQLESISQDSLTARIPLTDQSQDVRRQSVTGTAVLSLDDGAARVAVLVQSLGDQVRLHLIAPAELIQRRRYTRAPLHLPVKLRWRDQDDGPWQHAESRTQDVSLGGVRVADAPTVWPRKGRPVRITLGLPHGAVEEKATVVGLTPGYELRLSFDGLSPLAHHWLENLIEGE
jgi:hypothetical protein